MKIRIVTLFFLSTIVVSCSEYRNALKSDDYDYKIQIADKLYKEEKYEKSLSLYLNLSFVFRQTDRYEEILYKTAMASFMAKNYFDAEDYFKEFLIKFPFSEKVEQVTFNHALCYYHQIEKDLLDPTMTEMTISEMLIFIKLFSSSEYISKALNILQEARKNLERKDSLNSELYLKLGHYQAAHIYFNNLIVDFPESTFTSFYKYKSIISYYKFAELSIKTKRQERFQKVVDECEDFYNIYKNDRYTSLVSEYQKKSEKNIKELL